MVKNKAKAIDVIETLAVMFPKAECELAHTNAFELTVAVILSAQATDVSVNKVTGDLFQSFPTPFVMAKASPEEIEPYIRTIGLFRTKAKSLHLLSCALVERFSGEVPGVFEDLISLPGVGRKSANVVLSVWFDIPAFAVDTHVDRVSKRLQFCKKTDTVLEVEKKMCRFIPQDQWNRSHHYFIFFGRYLCKAAKPECDKCPFWDYCLVIKEKRKLEEKEKRRLMQSSITK